MSDKPLSTLGAISPRTTDLAGRYLKALSEAHDRSVRVQTMMEVLRLATLDWKPDHGPLDEAAPETVKNRKKAAAALRTD